MGTKTVGGYLLNVMHVYNTANVVIFALGKFREMKD